MNRAKCRKCGDEIESKYRHDFQRCSCKTVAVDGGDDYQRVVLSAGATFDDVEVIGSPKVANFAAVPGDPIDGGTTAEEASMTTEDLACELAALMMDANEGTFASLNDVEDVMIEGREVWPPALRAIFTDGTRFKLTIEREL